MKKLKVKLKPEHTSIMQLDSYGRNMAASGTSLEKVQNVKSGDLNSAGLREYRDSLIKNQALGRKNPNIHHRNSDYFGAGLNNGDINGSYGYNKIGRIHSGSLPKGIGVIHSNVESSYALPNESKERIHEPLMEDKMIIPALSSGNSPNASMANVIVLKKDGKTSTTKNSRNTGLSQYLKTLNTNNSPK